MSRTAPAVARRGQPPKARSPNQTNQVRIVGGRHRGRKLIVADAPGLRPTPDRVRETLFNWLGQNLTGWHCLDLFAGSGALGFEAASRGAAEAILVEQAAPVARCLQAAAHTLGDPAVRVVCADALAYLKRPVSPVSQRLDLVFLDPPYGQGWLDRIIMPLLPHLADDARLYIEAEQALPDALAPGLICLRRGHAGQVHYHLYAYSPESTEFTDHESS